MKTAIDAAPRPSDEEMLHAIAELPLREFLRLKMRLWLLLISRIARANNL